MKQAILIVIFISISMTIFSQEIVWEKLPFNTVDEINYDNDSLVNMTQLPFNYYENNGLIYRVASTEYDDFQKEDWVKENVNEHLKENQIKDNGKEENKYAITWESGYYELKKHTTEKRYYYGEGSGVLDYTVIKETPGYNQEGIFCIINDTFSYPNTKFKLKSISPSTGEEIIKPNQSCNLKFENSDYILDYTSDFCNGQFEVDGFATISPTYYNLKLKIKDLSNNKNQTIWQIPYEQIYQLRDIEIGDINNDKKQDIVLTIVDELCIKRILYLSDDSRFDKLFRYVGTMMIYCDYP
ncbi:hypothetical protein [Draconibacterium sediminis]|uniref:hypothetical protein n=1 Tax=Draconibacterium sediminis TaxID=1544798 RepID=UPI0026F11E68|nr:hypothetical protein [Draconibacterium sediminis]